MFYWFHSCCCWLWWCWLLLSVLLLLKSTAKAVLQHPPPPGRDILILNPKKKRDDIAGSLGPAQSSCENTNVSLKAEGDFNSDNPSHPRISYFPRPMCYAINKENCVHRSYFVTKDCV